LKFSLRDKSMGDGDRNIFRLTIPQGGTGWKIRKRRKKKRGLRGGGITHLRKKKIVSRENSSKASNGDRRNEQKGGPAEKELKLFEKGA